jgi:HSP20 family molecular chaperone IbpA
MAPSIHEPAGQRGRQRSEGERQDTRFERSPWARVTFGERKNARVTIWDGFKAIVIALSFPDGMLEDIQVSVLETTLTIRGSARNLIVSEHIDLPCVVETHLIRVDDARGTMYLLLRKK